MTWQPNNKWSKWQITKAKHTNYPSEECPGWLYNWESDAGHLGCSLPSLSHPTGREHERFLTVCFPFQSLTHNGYFTQRFALTIYTLNTLIHKGYLTRSFSIKSMAWKQSLSHQPIYHLQSRYDIHWLPDKTVAIIALCTEQTLSVTPEHDTQWQFSI